MITQHDTERNAALSAAVAAHDIQLLDRMKGVGLWDSFVVGWSAIEADWWSLLETCLRDEELTEGQRGQWLWIAVCNNNLAIVEKMIGGFKVPWRSDTLFRMVRSDTIKDGTIVWLLGSGRYKPPSDHTFDISDLNLRIKCQHRMDLISGLIHVQKLVEKTTANYVYPDL